MRVVIVGATGNAGTSLIKALEHESQVDEIVGLARRVPASRPPKTTWVAADIRNADLTSVFRSADVVVHLAWSIQPSRDLEALYSTNIEGSIRVFRAAADAHVSALVYASSIGAYSPGPKEYPIDESWPTDGIPTSFYSRHKAETEKILDSVEDANPTMRVVRLRPALKFKKESAAEQRRLFAGPFFPGSLVGKGVPVVPDIPRLRFQCVHSYDIGEAYKLAAISDVRGAFNVAADPIIDSDELASMFGARKVPVPESFVRAACDLTWRARLHPTPPGWVDLAFQSPLMDSGRARKELGWEPRYSSKEALFDLLAGMRENAGADTPTMSPDTGGPGRIRELLTGVGAREV